MLNEVRRIWIAASRLEGSTRQWTGYLFVRGRSFQRVRVPAVEHELTSLVMHRRPRGYDARVSLRCQLSDFELGIQRVPRMHFFQKPAQGARKRKKHVADVLRKQSGTRSSEGENLQSMHHRSSMPVSSRILDIVVDWVIVSRNGLEAEACASVSVRLGARNTSPTRKSSNLRGGTTVKPTGSKEPG